ncbi:MAG: hypothetical protein F6K48_14295 [Okeania sp. SIO3H1]|uniref:hypothetical protein n=1 Tax=Okeania sp. SIO1I7 TaxID=2607772 RepID=UPI0013CCCB48|nr:hypothetical protein [Okeania sp. SIO1I7]NEN90016.1 hypothetical protein [Okeania sp. SIO3H1]NET24969.1 hypothetical protein [Okeania sp. SIO1I7]
MTKKTQLKFGLSKPDIEALASKLGEEFQLALVSTENLEAAIYRDITFSMYHDTHDLTDKEIKLELVKVAKFSLMAAETFKVAKAAKGS